MMQLQNFKEDYKGLENEFDELALSKFELEKKHTKTVRKVKELEKKKEKLDKENENKSVRVDVCNKKLRIIEYQGKFHVSADQDLTDLERNCGVVKCIFWYPSAMNVRQAVRGYFDKQDIEPIFEQLEALLNSVMNLRPKKNCKELLKYLCFFSFL